MDVRTRADALPLRLLEWPSKGVIFLPGTDYSCVLVLGSVPFRAAVHFVSCVSVICILLSGLNVPVDLCFLFLCCFFLPQSRMVTPRRSPAAFNIYLVSLLPPLLPPPSRLLHKQLLPIVILLFSTARHSTNFSFCPTNNFFGLQLFSFDAVSPFCWPFVGVLVGEGWSSSPWRARHEPRFWATL